MGGLSPSHWLIVILIAIILFGAKRLPDAARGLGRSLRIFKSEMKEMHEGDEKSTPATQQEPPQLAAAPEQRGQVGNPQATQQPGTQQTGQQP